MTQSQIISSTNLSQALSYLLTENEGVVIKNSYQEHAFDEKLIVFKFENQIIVEPYIGTAEVGEIIAVAVYDDV